MYITNHLFYDAYEKDSFAIFESFKKLRKRLSVVVVCPDHMWNQSNEFPPVKPEIQYYVKYDVKMNMLRKKGNRTILFKTPKGDERVTYNFVYGTTTWNGTFGPFKSGDEVYLNCTMETDGVIESSISVSEDGKPFVVKRHGELSYSDNCRLSYTLGNP